METLQMPFVIQQDPALVHVSESELQFREHWLFT